MAAVIEIFMIGIFVFSGGYFFTDKYENNHSLRVAIGTISIIGTILIFSICLIL